MNDTWYKSNIEKGAGIGRLIDFPTINLNPVPKDIKCGVYSCEVEIDNEYYTGVMHIGPKSIGSKDKKKNFCEIHLLNFNKSINNKEVKFKTLKKIRDVREFKSKEDLQLQIKQDIKNAKFP
jgi:riboflavin kinase/FMN adenylyltransferase